MPERVLPPSALLTQFFRERHPRSAAVVAALLGWPTAQVEDEARWRDALLPGGAVDWYEAASWLLEAWPIDTLLRQLGPHAGLLPAGLHLVPMRVDVPAYLLVALHVQWRIEPMPHRTVRPPTFADYMADLLHRSIDSDTVDLLREDREFLLAYHFPGDERGEPARGDITEVAG